MKSLSKFFAFSVILFASVFVANSNAKAQPSGAKVPSEVQAIVGSFSGSWTSFTINEKGEVLKQSAWKDTIRAEKPTAAVDRAYVETVDEMIFEGGRITPQTVIGKEGYFLSKEGLIGDYYVEFFGQTIPMKKLANGVVAYSIPGNSREFTMLGDKFISATHVLVKTTTFEQGTEVHNITRVTDVRWKDAEGKPRYIQFVSLTGHHSKLK